MGYKGSMARPPLLWLVLEKCGSIWREWSHTEPTIPTPTIEELGRPSPKMGLGYEKGRRACSLGVKTRPDHRGRRHFGETTPPPSLMPIIVPTSMLSSCNHHFEGSMYVCVPGLSLPNYYNNKLSKNKTKF